MNLSHMALLEDSLLDSSGDTAFALIVVAIALIFFSLLIAFARRYKRCPSNRVLVIYGRAKEGRVARTLHGGGSFVLPILEDYEYLSLDPMQIEREVLVVLQDRQGKDHRRAPREERGI